MGEQRRIEGGGGILEISVMVLLGFSSLVKTIAHEHYTVSLNDS